MSTLNSTAASEFLRLLGTSKCPLAIDARINADFDVDPCLIPTAPRRSPVDVSRWLEALCRQHAVVVCVCHAVVCVYHKGLKLSQGVAGWLLRRGGKAEVLGGGIVGWVDADMPHAPAAPIPTPDENGETAWVSRARTKVDRKACPRMSRRFVEARAASLFVVPSQVQAVAENFGANPFGEEGVPLSHSSDRCRFDTILDHFELESIATLLQLATIIRGADTDQLDLAPQAAGLLATA